MRTKTDIRSVLSCVDCSEKGPFGELNWDTICICHGGAKACGRIALLVVDEVTKEVDEHGVWCRAGGCAVVRGRLW